MSRDGNGNYTPPLNPVEGGQPIEADWANDTINDLAAALTDSLSRSGNGNMLAAFRATDGTVTIPAIAFTNEPNSGLYRAATGDYRLCVNGKDKARIRDVNGMAAFQVFDLAGTGAWETLATAADVSALTLADILAVGNTTGGTDIVLTDGDVITGTADPVIKPPAPYVGYAAPGIELQTSSGFARVSTTEIEAKLWYGAAAGLSAQKLATTAVGIDVTGTVEADGFSGTGSVTVTDFIDDDSFATASAANVPTAESVKAYVDAEVGGQDTLAEILAVGNTTGGTDIDISGGSNITSSQTAGFTIESNQGLFLYTNAAFGAGIGSNFSVFNTASPGFPAGSVAITPTISRFGGDVALIFNYTDAIFYDNIRLADSSVQILSNDDIVVKPAAAKETVLTSSEGRFRVQSTETFAALYYGADKDQTAAKLKTSAAGIDVTGTVTADGVSLGDDEKAFFGAGNDLQIFHSGSDSFIKDAGTGILSIQTDGDFIALRDSAQSLDMAKFTTNGSAALNYTGSTGAGTKLETTSTGVGVTGTVAASDGLTADYIDLTGGESTTTTGTIACKMIVLDDASSDQSDASTIFTEGTGLTSSLVISQADDVADKIKLRVGSAGTLVDALTASTTGIDVTGTVTANQIAAPNTYIVIILAAMPNPQDWNGKQVWNKYAGNTTVTLPTDVQAPAGFSTTISVLSSGFTMTLTPDTGDTIKYLDPVANTWSGAINTDLVINSGGIIDLIRTGVNEWTVYGSGVV